MRVVSEVICTVACLAGPPGLSPAAFFFPFAFFSLEPLPSLRLPTTSYFFSPGLFGAGPASLVLDVTGGGTLVLSGGSAPSAAASAMTAHTASRWRSSRSPPSNPEEAQIVYQNREAGLAKEKSSGWSLADGDLDAARLPQAWREVVPGRCSACCSATACGWRRHARSRSLSAPTSTSVLLS